MAVFIASDEAGSFTGQDVNTPGGSVMCSLNWGVDRGPQERV